MPQPSYHAIEWHSPPTYKELSYVHKRGQEVLPR